MDATCPTGRECTCPSDVAVENSVSRDSTMSNTAKETHVGVIALCRVGEFGGRRSSTRRSSLGESGALAACEYPTGTDA